MEKLKKKYLFIDECGAPEFYGKRKKLLVGQPGYQPLLIVGMIMTEDRKLLRKKVLEFQEGILADPLYKSIPSLNKPKGWYLHAKDDHPEVRSKFFEFLRNLKGFETYVVIGRKKLELFTKKHNNNPSEFYFDILHHLLKNSLVKPNEFYDLYLADRKKTNISKFTNAVTHAFEQGDIKKLGDNGLNYKCNIVKGKDFPEISIIDYLLWSLQRYIIRKESRFYDALKDKYVLILDLYDFKNVKKASDFDL